jgi:hypothetical protein
MIDRGSPGSIRMKKKIRTVTPNMVGTASKSLFRRYRCIQRFLLIGLYLTRIKLPRIHREARFAKVGTL